MTKIKALYLVVGLLIATNIGLLIWTTKAPMHKHGHKKHTRHEGPKKLVAKKLNFSEEQIQAYERIIKEHQTAVKETHDKIRLKKNELYGQLNADSTSTNSLLIGEISDLFSEMETIHYNHFEDIKAICTQEQLPLFEELTTELSTLFAPHPKNQRRSTRK